MKVKSALDYPILASFETPAARLLRMRFFNAIKNAPHPEVRPQGGVSNNAVLMQC
jgi:hypothetical protein